VVKRRASFYLARVGGHKQSFAFSRIPHFAIAVTASSWLVPRSEVNRDVCFSAFVGRRVKFPPAVEAAGLVVVKDEVRDVERVVNVAGEASLVLQLVGLNGVGRHEHPFRSDEGHEVRHVVEPRVASQYCH